MADLMPSDAQRAFLAALGLGPADLAANRAGALSARQQRRLLWGEAGVLALAGVLAALGLGLLLLARGAGTDDAANLYRFGGALLALPLGGAGAWLGRERARLARARARHYAGPLAARVLATDDGAPVRRVHWSADGLAWLQTFDDRDPLWQALAGARPGQQFEAYWLDQPGGGFGTLVCALPREP